MRTSRKRLLDRKTDFRDAALRVIATEGEKTEKQYFEIFHNPRIRVVVLPTEVDGRSAPRHVLDRLDTFKETYDLGPGDELWLMFDMDRRRPEELSPVCQEAEQKGIRLAISNPCFELWLWLHLADGEMSDTNCKAIEARLRSRLGSYNKANLDCSVFAPRISEAVQRAKALHVQPGKRWPSFPGTHVYKLIEQLV